MVGARRTGGHGEGERQVSTAISGVTARAGGPASPGRSAYSRGGSHTTASATGFVRVTIVAPDSRIDVALPEDIPVADIYPEILRLSGQTPEAGGPVGYHLVRRDGSVLDSSRTFGSQRILDGDVLALRPFSESLPPAVFDDVSDAVASAVAKDRTMWSDGLMRTAGLIGGGVVLVLMGFVLWFAEPTHDMHSLPGILAAVAGVLLVAIAGVRARVYGDRASAVALGLGAMPLMMIAGSGLIAPTAGHGIGRLQFLLGCVAVLLAAAVLIALSPTGDGPFVAVAFAATTGTLVTFIGTRADLAPTEAAALCAPFALGAIAFLPGLSTRFARLPIGYATPRSAASYDADPDAVPETEGAMDAERIAVQARRGHELLVGLVGGCATVSVGAAAVLGFSSDGWAQLLALATGLSLLLRAHLFRYTSQVTCMLVAGLGSLVLLGVGMALRAPMDLMIKYVQGDTTGLDIRTVWLTAVFALAAAVIVAIGLIVPRSGVTPFWGRFMEIFESLALLSLLPLTLAVLDAYSAVRSLTS
ncbi:ESX-5 secretion system protein EccD5 [Streptomyces sp. RB5]|uniref:ESX-5 secretion system protein EccD5 n=1 Tax=Streptomyces smaragdinus TaxID=2585196 RepID=A0A7K0CRS0_9ACTN|nr:type VII secretion integral membrane protein EccD [Streptomyces smaragdinus]MQY16187.1 ESX-5 secretion system protein EccD5 [Streptomyces smaragdinus]